MKIPLKTALLLALPLLAWAAFYGSGLSPAGLLAGRDALKAFAQSHELMAFFAYFLVYVVMVAAAVPASASLTLLGGFLFGGFWGGVAAMLGAGTGACAFFLLARGVLRDSLAARASGIGGRLKREFEHNALNYLLFLRLVPIFPFFLVNLAAAWCRIPLSTFALATFPGILPGAFVFAYLGEGLDEALATGSLISPRLWLALAGLGVFALLPVFFRKAEP
jgi:uncharacterized membrane protein YdjX (TVP38/TMEM64 family)